MGGGAAFWAARGVRIEPELGDDDKDEVAAEPAQELEEPEPEAAEVEEAAEVVAFEQAAELEDAVRGVVVERAAEVPAAEVEDAEDVEVAEDVEAVEEVEPVGARVVEEPPLTGFPQQRSSAPIVAEAEPAAEPATASTAEDDPSAEPAWQLTGGELALPLPPLKTCVEAILMVVDEPTTVVSLAQVLERPTIEVLEALTALAEEYTVQGRGFELREVGIGGDGERTGWRIYSRAECAPVVERFVRDGQQAKLTQAALETLAVVAYRQPVSRSKVSAIRGVNCDGVMRTLLARGLVEEHGNDLETGAVLYQTTGYFLERMGLKGLDELPELAPLLPSAADVDIEDFA
jgi:segregation and condensation protein B